MTLKYLCARHCELVARDGEQASRLWWGAYNHGVEAYRTGDWRRARTFLGTAYEIMLLRFARDLKQNRGEVFIAQFVATGRFYSNVLCHLRDFDAAEACLSRVHDGLLHWSGEQAFPYQERIQAFAQVGEFRQKLVALLAISGKGSYAKCVDLIARQVANQVGAALHH